MAKAVAYFSLKGGLNTESSPLNIPPEDCLDILNCNLNVDSSIERRRGVDFIGTNVAGNYLLDVVGDTTLSYGAFSMPILTPFVFTGYNEDGTINKFVLIKVGTEIRIYLYTSETTLAENDATYQTITLAQGEHIHFKTSFSSYRNRIFVINPKLPFVILKYYDGVFQKTESDIFVRDIRDNSPTAESRVSISGGAYSCIKNHFSDDATTQPSVGINWHEYWVYDGVAVSEPAWSGSTLAGGYVSIATVIEDVTYYEEFRSIAASTGVQPGVTANWKNYWIVLSQGLSTLTQTTAFPAWDSGTAYSPPITTKYKTNITNELSNGGKLGGFTSGCFSTGRFWLTGNPQTPNTVYVSQSVVAGDEYNRMYQFANPYSTTDSQIVDTDGTTIVITEANLIHTIIPFSNGAICAADNGIWYIGGTDGFKATSISINRVSSAGVMSQDSICSIGDALIAFCNSGVYGIKSANTVSGLPEAQLISTKIQSLYLGLPLKSRETASVFYNPTEQRVYYLCNVDRDDNDEAWNITNQPTMFRDMLVLDLKSGSWFKHSIESQGRVCIAALFNIPGDFTSTTDPYSGQVTDESLLNTLCVFTKVDETGGTNTAKWAFGALSGDTNVDFSSDTTSKASFSSYITMAHQNYGTVIRKREATYITTIFERTETGVIDGATNLDVRAGGCLMRVDWNWATSSDSPYFGTLRQVYFPNKYITSTFSGAGVGNDVVMSKHKIRGWGNVFRFHFENDGDKPFKLLGWELLVQADPTP